jgi:hypothetical protein
VLNTLKKGRARYVAGAREQRAMPIAINPSVLPVSRSAPQEMLWRTQHTKPDTKPGDFSLLVESQNWVVY